MGNVGFCLEKGYGVEKNIDEAAGFYYKKLKQNGFEAKKKLDEIYD